MAVPTPTPALTLEDFFSTTLSGAIIATDTVIPVNSVPTSAEGFLALDQDNGSREIIYYTSKGASTVTCPSAALGRGQGGTTAASHSSGATVKMNMVSQLWLALQSGAANTGLAQRVKELASDLPYVYSGGVWSGDSYASTRNASMTALVCYINGRRISISAVTARSFTASKDTYVDVLDNADNTGTLVYTEVTNNAASPALASNSMRLAIVVTGASNIAAVGSINQGQVGKVLPIASSIPYMTTDSLGNLICPRDPMHRVLGMRQITSNFSAASGAPTQITGLTVPVIVPTGRRIRVSAYARSSSNSGAAYNHLTIWDGVIGGAGNQIADAQSQITSGGVFPGPLAPMAILNPAAGAQSYYAGFEASAGTGTIDISSALPCYLLVELI